MTTMNIADISHKKKIPTHYAPNSYRIFCEDIDGASLPENYKYANTAPEIYSHPQILPAQAIEDRNRPHGGRNATFLRENVNTLNEPVAVVHGVRSGLTKDTEKRWWEWNAAAQDDDPNWKHKKRSQTSANPSERTPNNVINGGGSGAGFQTTYQKEHGYLTTDFYRKPGNLNTVQGGMMRHTNNPNTIQATGIVPVTDFKNYVPDNQERVLVDKVSFENIYDARDQNNYPNRGKRQGAFVIEQIEPKPLKGTKTQPDMNKGASVWDCMHIDDPNGKLQARQNTFTKTFSAKSINNEARNQRRDPIGYFEDTKYINANQNTEARPNSKYTPSWSNAYTVNNNDVNNNIDLMANGVSYPQTTEVAN